MPTYEYQCTKCGRKFEALQKITAPPLKKCPGCGGVPKRLIGLGSGIIFKGPGFHATDYRSADYKEKEKQDKGLPPCNPSADCSKCPKAG